MKFIAIAALGALLVTGATAAVMSQTQKPDSVRIEPNTEPEVKFLLDEIRKKDTEIQILRRDLDKRINNAKELEQIKQQLEEKTQELEILTAELIKEKAKKVPNAKPIVAQITSEQITTAIQSAVAGNIKFAFQDLDSRANSGAVRGTGVPKDRNYSAVVRLSVTPSGTAFDLKTSGLDYSESTRLFIEDALKRVAYPKGSDALDVRITINWQRGDLAVVAAVVGQRASAGSSLLDL